MTDTLVFERNLQEAFDRYIAAAPTEIDAVAVARTVGVIRPRRSARWLVPGRRGLALIVVGLIGLAVVAEALIGAGPRRPIVIAASPSPSSSGAPRPTPSLVEAGAGVLEGVWTRPADPSQPSVRLSIRGTSAEIRSPEGLVQFSERIGVGSGVLTLTATSPSEACSPEPGEHVFRLNPSGDAFTVWPYGVTSDADPCPARAAAFDGTWILAPVP